MSSDQQYHLSYHVLFSANTHASGFNNGTGVGLCEDVQEFQCENGQCIQLSWICDDEVDCGKNGKFT